VALKRNICIYLIVYINFYSFTDLSRGSASQRGDFFSFLFLFIVCVCVCIVFILLKK